MTVPSSSSSRRRMASSSSQLGRLFLLPIVVLLLLLLLFVPDIPFELLQPPSVGAFVLPPQAHSSSSSSSSLFREDGGGRWKRSCSTTTTTTQLFWFNAAGDNKNNNNNNNNKQKIPYLIERIPAAPKPDLYSKIANLCINVFFKERLGAKPDETIAPWKEVQINYLKGLQTSDLRVRRARYPHSNEMFLAYQVVAATPSKKQYLSQPLILDLDQVYHKQQLLQTYGSDADFVKGDLLGFVEITQRAYGLGDAVVSEDDDNDDDNNLTIMRPILTNLAVRQDARTSGIGSKLLNACEQHIVRQWNMKECVLEVEDYNTSARNWYQNRGYQVLFSDPAAKRYDVSGVVLKKVRGQRDVLRKVLTLQQAQKADSTSAEALSVGNALKLFTQQLRETVGAI